MAEAVEENKLSSPRDIFCDACARDDISTVKRLLDEDMDYLDCVDHSGYSPLHWSVLYNCINCARFLLSKGADPLFKGIHGDTPLHWATAISSEQCLDILISNLLG